MKYKVATLRDLKDSYTYSSDDCFETGQLVCIDFRNKEDIGVITGDGDQEYTGKIKQVSSILPYKIPDEYVKFAEFVGAYNLTNLGNILKLIVPFSIDKILMPEKNLKCVAYDDSDEVSLSEEQLNAVNKMNEFAGRFKVTLLHGITGSGKTEVFLEFAKEIINSGKQVLILVPEVALSTDLSKKVASRFKAEVHIWHNSISPAKKLAIWKKAINGEKIAIVGARSALFVPFSNLGCIVIDEEHDSSFKQSEGTIYNARDMGVYLGSCLNIPVILSSATPSVESYNNSQSGKYEYIKLNSRYFANATLPEVFIDDLRQYKLTGVLSNTSAAEIKMCLDQGKQALVFVNRRGHTPKVLCKSCGWKVLCPGCETWLCYHNESNGFVCHHCGFKTGAKKTCEECGEHNLIGIGAGVEKVHQELESLFPEAKILAISSDITDTPNKIDRAIESIKNSDVDIIVGTQIVAKGHNFNNLNLIVITCVDAMLYGDDFRSNERAFQLLHQVSGRAGRTGEHGKGRVIIQTYTPDDDLIKILQYHNIEKLYETEISNRRMTRMPPFGRMVAIILSALSEAEVSDFAKKLVRSAPCDRDIKILGPVQPALFKLRSRYRLRILVASQFPLQNYINKWLCSIKIPKYIKMTIDVDPQDFF